MKDGLLNAGMLLVIWDTYTLVRIVGVQNMEQVSLLNGFEAKDRCYDDELGIGIIALQDTNAYGNT